MKGRGTPEEKILLDLVMRDLAALHKKDVNELWDEYEDYFPWDFYRDEFQLGKSLPPFVEKRYLMKHDIT